MHSLTKANVAPSPTLACPSSSRRALLVTRACQQQNGALPQQAATVILSAGLAVGLVLSPAADAKSLTEQRREQEELILSQEKKLEYLIQLQENARKADLLGKRQALENRVEQVEDVIQRKLVEEKANEQAAGKKGEEERALRIAAEEEQIQAQEAALKVAAAKAAAELERQEIVEEAKVVEQKQQVAEAANSLMELLGITQADLGL